MRNCSKDCAKLSRRFLDPVRYARGNTVVPLKVAITRIRIVARVINAVFLQQGLIDGSIPVEEAIAEILFFGVIKFVDLTAVAAKDVGKVLDDLKTLQTKLIGGSEKTEAVYQLLFQLKKLIESVVDVSQWQQKAALQSDLNLLKTNGPDFQVFDDLARMKRNLQTYSEKIVQLSKDGEEDKSGDAFGDIAKYARNILLKSSEMAKNVNNMVKLATVESATTAFSEMSQLSDAVSLFIANQQDVKFDDGAKAKMKTNIGVISDARTKAAPISPILSAIHTIHKNRKNPDRYRSLKHTPGFINGYEDVASLDSALSDPWLKQIVNTDGLTKAFSALQPFILEAHKIFNELGPLQNQDPNPIDDALELVQKLVSSGSMSSDAGTLIDTMFECVDANLVIRTFSTQTDLNDLKTEIDQFDAEMNRAKTSLREIADYFQSAEITKLLQEVEAIALKAASKDANLKDLVGKFVKYETELNAMFKKFDSFTVSSATIQNAAQKVLNKFPTVDGFEKTLNGFKTTFECLKKQNFQDVQTVKQMIDNSVSFRTQPADSLKDMDKIMDLINVFQIVKDFSKMLAEMKSKQNEESKAADSLLPLALSGKNSKIIGGATRGIVHIKELNDQKPKFDAVKTISKQLDNALKALPKEQAADLVKVQAMADALEVWMSSVKASDSKKLTDYAGIFSEAKKVLGIDNVAKLSAEVEKLINSEQDPAKKSALQLLKNALDELGAIGTNLSGYQEDFGNCQNSLAEVELFFARYLKKDDNQVSTEAPGSFNRFVDSVRGPDGSRDWIIGGVLGGVAVVIVASLILCWCKKWLCFKKKKENNDLEEGKPVGKDGKKTTHTNAETNATATTNTPTTQANGSNAPAAPAGVPAQNPNAPNNARVDPAAQQPSQVNQNPDAAAQDPPPVNDRPEEPDAGGQRQDQQDAPAGENRVDAPARRPLIATELSPGLFDQMVRDVYGLIITYKRNQKWFSSVRPKPTKIENEDMLQYIVEKLCGGENPKKGKVKKQENRFPHEISDSGIVTLCQDLYQRCHFKNSYINANLVTLPNGNRMIMTQTPILKNEERDYRTDDKFLYMVAQVGAGAIVSICDKEELEKGLNGEPNYGRYFPNERGEITIHRHDRRTFKVKCQQKTSLLGGKIIHRTLEILYGEENEPLQNLFMIRDGTETTNWDTVDRNKEVDQTQKRIARHFLDQKFSASKFSIVVEHYQLIGWSAGTPPESTESAVELLKLIQGVNTVVVHCSDGVERSGAFVCMEKIRQELAITKTKGTETVKYDTCIAEIREYRTGAIFAKKDDKPEMENVKQVAFLLMAVLDYALKYEQPAKKLEDHPEKEIDKYTELLECFKYSIAYKPEPGFEPGFMKKLSQKANDAAKSVKSLGRKKKKNVTPASSDDEDHELDKTQ